MLCSNMVAFVNLLNQKKEKESLSTSLISKFLSKNKISWKIEIFADDILKWEKLTRPKTFDLWTMEILAFFL